MKAFGRIVPWLSAAAILIIISGCALRPGTASPDSPQDIQIVDQGTGDWITSAHAPDILYCPGLCSDRYVNPCRLIVHASLKQHPDGIESVILRYRLRGYIRKTPWSEVVMHPSSLEDGLERYSVTVFNVGADAESFHLGSSGWVEYQVRAQYKAGIVDVWPVGASSYASAPIKVYKVYPWAR